MSLFESASLVVTPNGTKASKLYAIKPTSGAGDLSVTRATTATRVNSAGLIESVASNVPRLDYTNSSCPSILVEPQRTNQVTYSEQFDNAAWTTSAFNVTVTANNVISPDGTQNADRVVFGLNGYLYQEKAIVSWASVTFSIYSKTATQKIFFGGASPAGTDVYSSINVGNGWFRQILTRTFTAGGTGLLQIIPIGSNETLYFWGCQVEQGSYPTSYIPTTTASVTRNADVISKTGISSLIGQTEGTLFIDANISLRSNTRVLLDVQDGTNNDTFQFVLGGNSLTVNIYDGGILQAGLNGGYCLGRKKIALGYKANDFVLYIDGVQIATDTSGSIPAASLIALGYLYIAGGFELGDSINTFANWKTRLSNSELGTLTTL
jgi:hypothetical protein